MNASQHSETAPQDRVPLGSKLAYGAGAFVNNLLGSSIGGMMIIFNLGLGMNPALVGVLGFLPRITDAITDPLMGFISDNTKSKWGRRRPYIFVGAILAAILYAAIWQLPEGKSEMFYFWYFLGGSIIFFLAYTIFVTPWVALGYELTPDYHERTRLMGVQNFIGQIPFFIAPYYLAIMQNERFFDNMVDGAGGLAIVIALITLTLGVLPAIFLRERNLAAISGDSNPAPLGSIVKQQMIAFFKGFATTMKSKPFLKLAVATFLVFNGFMMISALQGYVIIYYVFGGDIKAGSLWAGHAGMFGALSGLFVVLLIVWIGSRFGKRQVFFVTTGLSIVGYILKWFFYTPDAPWMVLIPAPFTACALAGLFTLMPAMIADVVDADELETHQRREGMYGSIFWWVVKLGVAGALLLGGLLLNATGFDVALEANQTDRALLLMRLADILIPIGTSLIAIWAIASYTITEEKANETRQLLEQRRGVI